MILACIENIFRCTKYNTVISLKVSAIITHPSRLTAEVCGTGESRCWSQAAGSEVSILATAWPWAHRFLLHAPHLQKRVILVPTSQGCNEDLMSEYLPQT